MEEMDVRGSVHRRRSRIVRFLTVGGTGGKRERDREKARELSKIRIDRQRPFPSFSLFKGSPR